MAAGHQESAFASGRNSLTVVAVGDILLARGVAQAVERAQNPAYPFRHVRELLSSADIAFANLECPLTAHEQANRSGVVFRCPSRYVPGLVQAGFDILSTANNHALDQGVEALGFTSETLISHGILPVGTGSSAEDARGGQVIPIGDTAVGFLAFSYAAYNDGGERTHPQVATWHDLDAVREEIGFLGERADVVIVSLHAGVEYRREPTRRQMEFAHAAVDAGADAVIGHHPHWIQEVEVYRGRPVFYSLGNFVFDQGRNEETREGLAVILEIEDRRLRGARLVPVVIEEFCCPRPASEAEKASILGKIGLASEILVFDEP